jgi:hypothetical protein
MGRRKSINKLAWTLTGASIVSSSERQMFRHGLHHYARCKFFWPRLLFFSLLQAHHFEFACACERPHGVRLVGSTGELRITVPSRGVRGLDVHFDWLPREDAPLPC